MSKQSRTESKFVVAVDFVNMRRSPVQTGASNDENVAVDMAIRQVTDLRFGLPLHGHSPGEVYSVYAYCTDNMGNPDRLVDQFFVRQKVSAAA